MWWVESQAWGLPATTCSLPTSLERHPCWTWLLQTGLVPDYNMHDAYFTVAMHLLTEDDDDDDDNSGSLN